jgi:hypothetical protein
MAKGYKTGGRSMGTPNKITAEAKQYFTNEIMDLWQSLKEPEKDFQLDSLSWDRRFKLLEAAMKYAQLPRDLNIDTPDEKLFKIEVIGCDSE